MYLHWEKWANAAGDCNIKSMSWMGRVPDEIPQDEGWKLNRSHYYQEGWLSTANLRGVVGVTYTASNYNKNQPIDSPARTNYNLRGHRAEVTLVRWNEPYQKLATCDASGIIFVWIKYEGRWSIELINDRNTPVICFSWSHDGRMALISYADGFVLVGSVSGQRYWSTLLANDWQSVTAGTWTPDDQHVYLATSQGGLIVMDVMGNTAARVMLRDGLAVDDLLWSCERFYMEEQAESAFGGVAGGVADGHDHGRKSGAKYVLAVCFRNGEIHLMRGYDDCIPQLIVTGLTNFVADWNNSGTLLAVAGSRKDNSPRGLVYDNRVKFYNEEGRLVYNVTVPTTGSPVTAVTWGHNDRRLFVATGNQIHVGWVSHHVASLQLLSRACVYKAMAKMDHVQQLPLPCRMQDLVGMLFIPTIRCCVPDPWRLRSFAVRPQQKSTRLHCTMIRHGGGSDESFDTTYTLYLEHLGGFLPILKGKKISKIRPEFVIFDPTLAGDEVPTWMEMASNPARRGLSPFDVLEAEADLAEDAAVVGPDVNSPRQRRRRRQNAAARRRAGLAPRYGHIEACDYSNILPEHERLAEVTSNFWGTRFQIVSHNLDLMPPTVGEVIYKASLLHLQPRQMRLEIVDLGDEGAGCGDDADDDNSDLIMEETLNDSDDDILEREITMRDGILRAVRDDRNALVGCPLSSSATQAPAASHVAPIAPLPTRLSFCLPPPARNAQNESSICDVVLGQERLLSEELPSPTIRNVAHVAMRADICIGAQHQDVVVVDVQASPSRIKSPLLLSETCEVLTSKASRRLHMSISCDNYLSEAKLALSRRDSVGSGSPHSARGSPRRWAAKTEDLLPEAMAKTASPGRAAAANPSQCVSQNDLDTIADLLGVPSNLVAQRDLNRRLILLSEKKKRREQQHVDSVGRSKSCEASDAECADGATCRRRRRQREIEAKRRSIYERECRGRTEDKSCSACEAAAKEVKDVELNMEIFDVVHDETEDVESAADAQPKSEEICEVKQVEIVVPEEVTFEPVALSLSPSPQVHAKSRGLTLPRRFDAVRSVLEKVRSVLISRRLHCAAGISRTATRDDGLADFEASPARDRGCSLPQPALLSVEVEEERPRIVVAHSSPNTPLMMRKGQRRNKSFSPVRAIMNSPLLRRRRQCPRFSEDPLAKEESDSLEHEDAAAAVSESYENLESFQRQQIKHKLCRPALSGASSSTSTLPPPPPTPAQQFLSPFLARKRLATACEPPPIARRPHAARFKRLVLFNKSPMWNEASQVYQLDFGGRVTQESAKNFQIEFKDKQVMQFGRIDSNAYTLDFEYPFSAVQAFGVALANVTQRLK